MLTVHRVWIIETEEYTFEYNGSHTVNVYDAEAPRINPDIDMWSISERYTSPAEFTADVEEWISGNP